MSSNYNISMPSDLFYQINYGSKFFIALVGLVFSITIIITIVINRQCHTVSNLLVCNTCVASTIHLILALVASIAGFGSNWAWNAPHCIARGYVFVAVIGTFCYSYSIQAISRMLFAVFYKYNHLLHWHTHSIMIMFSWFIGFLVPTIPLIFMPGSFGLETESRGCVLTSKAFPAAMFCATASFALPLGLVTVIYGIIFYHVHESTHRVMPFVTSHIRHSTRHSATRELKIVQQLVLQSGCLSCGGILYLINILWNRFSEVPLPIPMYLVGFSLMTNVISLMSAFQFFMNKTIKNLIYQRICQRFQSKSHSERAPTLLYTKQVMPRIDHTLVIYNHH